MTALLSVALAVLLLASFLCLYRIGMGPTAPDRTVAIDILGTLMVGFCCVTALWPHRQTDAGRPLFQGYFMTVAIAWALTSGRLVGRVVMKADRKNPERAPAG